MRMPNLLPRTVPVAIVVAGALAQHVAAVAADPSSSNPLAPAQHGVSLNRPGAFAGYSLIAPMNSTSTWLVDLEGRIVREWKSDYTPALSAYLLENGHLLRPAVNRDARIFDIPAVGGRIQEFDWDGNLVWDFVLEREGISPHHDICPLPNGHVLMIATESRTREQALAIGRRPESLGERLLVDCILEIKPTGPTSGEIVWEWHAWDHLIQDTDKDKPNYGEIAEHPERIDVNYGSRAFAAMTADPQQLAQLRTLGYVGGGPPGPNNPAGGNPPDGAPPADGDAPNRTQAQPGNGAAPPDGKPPAGGPPGGFPGPGGRRGPGIDGDWMHTNSIDYHAELDQIMLSVHGFSEVWIIDHGTTTAEAASHSGGRRGRGGDLLYRWGNPQAYRSGTHADQQLFGQHCAHWIPPGLPGAGHLLVFNNGMGRRTGSYSSVDEVVLPLNAEGTYDRDEFLAFGPDRAAWTYTSPDKSSFNSMLISGAQRLPNGNTFICSGNQGLLFEVTPTGEIVWVYKHPGVSLGFGAMNFARMGMFPDFVRGMLKIDEEQGKQLTALQADVDQRLAKILTEEQRQRLEQPPPMFGFGGPPGGGPPGGGPPPGGRGPHAAGPAGRGASGGGGPAPRGGRGFRPPRFGDVIPFFAVDALQLTNEQESQVAKVQADVHSRMKEILTADQQAQIDNWDRMFARGPGGGPPGGSPQARRPPGNHPAPNPGPDGNVPRDPDRTRPDGAQSPRGGPGNPPFGGPGGPPGPGGGPGGPGGIFRSYRYGADFAGFAGKDLTPGELLSEVAERALRPPPGGDRPQPPPPPHDSAEKR